MKKLFALLALAASFNAVAAPPLCEHVEFAELQTYSEAELEKLKDEYRGKALNVGYSERDHAESQNCFKEMDRVFRVFRDKRNAAKTAAK